jgi:hypothetical protein
MSKKQTTFYCFSPLVMIATCIIEVSLLLYTLFRYKMNTVARLSVATLGFLALFQLSEFTVCGATHWSAATWSRVGYMAITMLPPLGIHLIRVLSGRGSVWIVRAAYLTGIGFALIFGLTPTAFHDHICAGNYAIFQLAPRLGGIYFSYYYGWLMFGIGQALLFAATAKINTRKALLYQVFGWLSFLLPTGIVNALNPQSISGIPSVMCGFAVIYAIVLVFGILPMATKKSAKTRR